MSHSPQHTRCLGRVVARAGIDTRSALGEYASLFGRAMARASSRGKQVNVLQHGLGYFKRTLSRDARNDLAESIRAYEAGEVPLVVPVSLLAHRAKTEDVEYLARQTYLEPYPASLGLRNGI